MTPFVKWFLLNSVLFTAIYFAEQKDAFSVMIKNDASHLTIVIMALYVGLTLLIGHLSFHADVAREKDKKVLRKKSEIGWFCAEHFFSLGLLGTIIGLCIATQGSLSGSSEVSQIVAGLKHGLNTAFYTTICGIVFSLLLQIQLMMLKSELEE
tara:strand:- start:7288 stop:7746 length:459 start_codon:yes stop_codon:yes gene_type:complete